MSRVFPSPGSQFEPFLFAIICDETNGMQLTLVSAIARTGVDPWGEAARIAKLPRARARDVLTALIPGCPGVGGERPDAQAIADRLIALLPSRGARRDAENLQAPEPTNVAASSAEVAPSADARRHDRSKTMLKVLALCLGLALAIFFSTHLHPETGVRGAAPFGQGDQTGR